MATHSPYSCLENSMDREPRWATVHGVAELDTTELTHTHMESMTTCQDINKMTVHLTHSLRLFQFLTDT